MRQEPQDVAGLGITVPIIAGAGVGGTISTGTDQRFPSMFRDVQTLTTGTVDIALRFAAGSTLDRATIYQSIITIKRVS